MVLEAMSMDRQRVARELLLAAKELTAAKPVTSERVWDLMEELAAVNDKMRLLMRDVSAEKLWPEIEVPTPQDKRKLAEVWDVLNRLKIDLKKREAELRRKERGL
jgi:hypothetical protein